MSQPCTLGELRASGWRSRSVKDELRANLIRKLKAGEPVFPGLIGYDRTVIPRLQTAILSRQTAGIVKQSLVVNLPGKPGSIRVCLDAIFPAVPYCIDLIGGPYLEGNPAVVEVFRPQKK